MATIHRQVLVAYAAMEVCNPFSLSTVGRLLDLAEPGRDWRALDLGCGNGAVSAFVAGRYGLRLDAVERSPEIAAMARERAAALPAPGAVSVHEAEARIHLARAEPYDLLLALGASGLVDGPPKPVEVLGALAAHVKPGGWLLWGETFFRKDPAPHFAAMLGPYACFESHAGNVIAGEEAGLEIAWAAVSTDQDWEEFVWTNNRVTQAWLARNPDHPDHDAVAQRAHMMRLAWLMEGRETLGAALYLFRRPGG